MWKLVVLDHRHNRVVVYTGFSADRTADELEDFIADRHDLNDCVWMFTDSLIYLQPASE
jgi:hypothetical protein